MRRGKSSNMTEGRAESLEGYGLSLKVECKTIPPKEEERWRSHLEELRQIREEHGTAIIPRKFCLNPELAYWAENQRLSYGCMVIGKTSIMTEERAKRLEDLGFQWKVRWSGSSLHNTKRFQRRLELKQFRLEFGHTHVPQNNQTRL